MTLEQRLLLINASALTNYAAIDKPSDALRAACIDSLRGLADTLEYNAAQLQNLEALEADLRDEDLNGMQWANKPAEERKLLLEGGTDAA